MVFTMKLMVQNNKRKLRLTLLNDIFSDVDDTDVVFLMPQEEWEME